MAPSSPTGSDTRGTLKDRLRLELHETVNKLLTQVFHVRTPDDETKDRRDGSSIHPKTAVIAKPT